MSKLQGKEAQMILVNLGLDRANEIQYALKLKELVKESITNLKAPRDSDDSDQYHEREIIIKELQSLLEAAKK